MLIECEPGFRLIRGRHGIDRVVHIKMRRDSRIYPIGLVQDTIEFNCSLGFFYGVFYARFVFFLSEDLLSIDAGKKKSNYEKIFRVVHGRVEVKNRLLYA